MIFHGTNIPQFHFTQKTSLKKKFSIGALSPSKAKKELLERYGTIMPDSIPDQICEFLAMKSGKEELRKRRKSQNNS